MISRERTRDVVALDTLDPKRILLIKPSALGDIAHALPVLHMLRRRFPDAYIAWLVNRAYVSLLDHHPDLNCVIPMERNLFRGGLLHGISENRRLVRDLRSHRFDLVIDLQGLFRSGLLSRLSGAPVRVGLASAREGASWFYTHLANDSRLTMHAVDRYAKIPILFGETNEEIRFTLHAQPAARQWAHDFLRDAPRPWIAVGVGARWLTKRWPPAHFAELVRRAQTRFGGTALFLGSPDERPLADEAARLVTGPCHVVAGTTSLPQLVALLESADVVLANDTGPLHIAVALGRPVVAPYTCTQTRLTGPYRQLHRAVETSVACKGSLLRTCARLDCMNELGPDRLWPVLDEVLATWQRNRLSA